MTQVVELGLALVLALDELAGLHDAPHGPHRLRGGAPRAHLAFEPVHLRRERRAVVLALTLGFAVAFAFCGTGGGMCEVRAVEVSALVEGGVACRVKDVWNGPRVARRPLVEVVRNVEGRGVWRSVLKIDDYQLREKRVNQGSMLWYVVEMVYLSMLGKILDSRVQKK